jgi:hypothetical protein
MLHDLAQTGRYDLGNLLSVLIGVAKAEPGHLLQIGVQRVALPAEVEGAAEGTGEPTEPTPVARHREVSPGTASAEDVAAAIHEHLIQPLALPAEALLEFVYILRQGAADPEGVTKVMVELADLVAARLGKAGSATVEAQDPTALANSVAAHLLVGIELRLGRRATAEEVRRSGIVLSAAMDRLAGERENADRTAAAHGGVQ